MAAALVLLLPAATTAAPAALRPDPRFGDDGVARAAFRFKVYEGLGGGLVAGAPAGKLLVAGQILNEEFGPGSAVIARFDRRGRLDRSFGRRGKLRFRFPKPDPSDFLDTQFMVSSMVIQPDAKIVLAGIVDAPCHSIGCPTEDRFALVRLTPDGRIDPSFGDQGFVDRRPVVISDSPARSPIQAQLGAVSLQPDGSFLVGGFASAFFDQPGGAPQGQWVTRSRVILMRFRADGTVDEGFGDSGERRLDGELASAHWAPAPGRKLLAMGPHTPVPDGTAVDGLEVIRFGADGLLDPSFGKEGMVFIEEPDPYDFDNVASGPGGDLVVSGGPGYNFGSPHKLRRLTADGKPLSGFDYACPRWDPRVVELTSAIPFGQDTLASAVILVGREPRQRPATLMFRYGPGGCFRPRRSRLRLDGYLSIRSRDARGRVLLGGPSGHSLQIVRLVPGRRAETR